MQRTLKRRWIVFGAMVLFTASSVLCAKQGIVKMKDGRSFEGDVTEKPNAVVIVVRGISTTLNRDDVDSLQYVGNIEQQYQERLAKLPKLPSASAHLEIAKWLFDNHAYDLAMKEIQEVSRIDPNSAEAATLEQTILSQKRLDRSRVTPPANTTGTGAAGTGAAGTGATGTGATGTHPGEGGHTAAEHKYLSPEQINVIRQVEWPKDDNSVRATIPADLRKRYVAFAGENLGEFNALNPTDQARRILHSDVKELRKEVKLLSDPAPISDYRRVVQPIILKGCATVGCHGGAQGGAFFLYTPADNDPTAYTNFYLLTKYTKVVSGAQHGMIDRTYPDNSLLAELGLPPEISKVAHPPVNGGGIRPIFRGKDDPNYRAVISWMSSSLVLLPGAYGFEFSLDASTAPSPGPSTPKPATP